jgi:hypothetical protein
VRDVVILFLHLIVTLIRLARPGGLCSVVAVSVLVKHQLLILNRGRKRAPNPRATDRIVAGLCTLFLRPARLLRSAIALKPSTLLHLHYVMANRKHRLLFSPKREPLSHPFVERLVGTLRREFLDWTLFWTTADLEAKLLDFQPYCNEYRAHAGRKGSPPEPEVARSSTSLSCYRWQKHCRGLSQTPISASF